MCSAGGSWSARMAAAWTPKRPCRTKSWACTSPPAGARRAATSPPSSVTSTRSYWRRPSPPPPSRSSSSPPTTAPRRWWATCAPCTGTGWPCPSTTPTSSLCSEKKANEDAAKLATELLGAEETVKNFRQIQYRLELSGGILHLVTGLFSFQSDIPVGSLLMKTAKGKSMTALI